MTENETFKKYLLPIVGAVVALLAFSVMVIFGIGGTEKSSSSSLSSSSNKTNDIIEKQTMENVTELKIEDLKVGTGEEAVKGKTISVHYTGTLVDGTKFDSSKDRGTPFQFQLGAGRVIQGWDEGFAGMKVGGVRKLTIPSSMGYGAGGAPPDIGPNATLIFEVELLDVL